MNADPDQTLAELCAHPLLNGAVPERPRPRYRDRPGLPAPARAGQSAMKQVPSWPRAAELVGALGRLRYAPAVPAIVALWQRCPIEPVRQAAGHALLQLGTPEAHAALQAELETADHLATFLALTSIVAVDPAGAFERLRGYFAAEVIAEAAMQPLVGEILFFFGPVFGPSNHAHDGLLRDNPRWVEVALRLRRHPTLGPSARHLLASLERDEVVAALRRWPDPPPPSPRLYTGPRDFLARYERGEHATIWRMLGALGPLFDEGLRQEAAAVARATMARVRANVEQVTERLRARGYPFDPETPAWAPPAADLAGVLARIEAAAGGPLPASLRAFWEIVGEVQWVADDDEREQRRWNAELELVEADPLYVSSAAVAAGAVDEWQHFCTRHHPEVVGPLQLTLAPDHLRKANLGGGAPYAITVPNAAADAVLENEAHELPFTDYLRLCFDWGGFPRLAGVALSPRARSLLDELRHDLLPF